MEISGSKNCLGRVTDKYNIYMFIRKWNKDHTNLALSFPIVTDFVEMLFLFSIYVFIFFFLI